MKPLNKKDRTNAFLKFLAIFILGILIVLIPFYFLIRLPDKVEEVKTIELTGFEEQIDFQRDYFAVQMDSVRTLLNMFKNPGIDLDRLSANIGILLAEMEAKIAKDDTWRGKMNKNIIDTYSDLKLAKASGVDVSDDLSDLEEEIDELKEKLQECKDDLAEAKASGGGGGEEKKKETPKHSFGDK